MIDSHPIDQTVEELDRFATPSLPIIIVKILATIGVLLS